MTKKRVCSVENCERLSEGRGLCPTHYGRWYHHGNTDRQPGSKSELRGVPTEERFWAKVLKSEDKDGCWLWQAATGPKMGYGKFEMKYPDKGYQDTPAHRVAWILTHGQIPDGLFVCHSCDVPACVNPAHLFLGTHKDNMRDMADKGRARTGVRRARGEAVATAKLKEDQVREIRRLYAAGGISQQALADRYGVYQTKISALIHRKTWKHVI